MSTAKIDYRTIFEDNSNAILILDAERRTVLEANEGACRHFGYSREELIGLDAALLRPAEDVNEMRVEFRAIRAATLPRDPPRSPRTWRHVRKDGSIAHVEISRLLVDFDGCPAVIAIIRDVTKRVEFELALRESEERYRRLFEAAPLPIFVFDAETGFYLAANEAAVRKYGWSREELLQMTVFDIRPPEDVPRLKEFFAHLDDQTAENAGQWRHRNHANQTIDVEITTQAIEFAGRRARLAIVSDVTERRRLEEQLRQSHKMEATGLLAGAVAHDFNNLLGIILSASELAQRAAIAGRQVDTLVGEIREAATRAGVLTRKLLAFSRKQVLHVQVVDLREAVDGFLPILRRIVGEDVRLVVRRAPERLLVRADVSQLEQVLLNLCTNARQATPAGGEVAIETLHRRIGRAEATLPAGTKEGDYAEVCIIDTGCGMDTKTRERVFEPFFTTKSEGTGLGLAIVHGIVHQHQGLLHIDSSPARGTIVHVLLPMVEAVASETAVPATGEPREPGSSRKTILVAEDEPPLRRMIATALRELGYDVVTAQDGVEAVRVFEELRGKIAVALLDVVMPSLGGIQAYERMRVLDPALKVIFMTGYAPESAQVSSIVARGGHAVLTKPFSLEELERRTRATLDSDA